MGETRSTSWQNSNSLIPKIVQGDKQTPGCQVQIFQGHLAQ